MKTILLMDIVIVFVGIYLAVSAAKMKKSGQISDLVVPKEEIKKCKDPEAYIRGITPWLYGFAAVAVVVGAIGILCDTKGDYARTHLDICGTWCIFGSIVCICKRNA